MHPDSSHTIIAGFEMNAPLLCHHLKLHCLPREDFVRTVMNVDLQSDFSVLFCFSFNVFNACIIVLFPMFSVT